MRAADRSLHLDRQPFGRTAAPFAYLGRRFRARYRTSAAPSCPRSFIFLVTSAALSFRRCGARLKFSPSSKASARARPTASSPKSGRIIFSPRFLCLWRSARAAAKSPRAVSTCTPACEPKMSARAGSSSGVTSSPCSCARSAVSISFAAVDQRHDGDSGLEAAQAQGEFRENQ